MKKITIVIICLFCVAVGLLMGSAIERNYIIKSAQLVGFTEQGYTIAYGKGDTYEVHEYRN